MKQFLYIFCSFAISIAVLDSCTKPGIVNPGGHKDYTPIELTKAEQGISAEINGFGQELFKNLYQPQNQMISPLSVSLAFSMAAFGADGKTENQICSVLGFEDYNSAQIGSYYEKMIDALIKADKKTLLKVANSAWFADSYPILDTYKEGIKKFYHSDAYNVDFSSPETGKKINSWVSDNTGGKITDLVSDIDGDIKMLLVNALYFNGRWSNVFSDNTEFNYFTGIDGNKSRIDMKKYYKGQYSASEGFEMAEIPYGNTAYVMDVILPPDGMQFEDAVLSFDKKMYDTLLSGQEERDIDMKMPSFKFESSFDIVKALVAMGMDLPFTPLADFSKMSGQALSITGAVHKTSIEVDKEGTVAAAATHISFGMTASSLPVQFFINRPFIFVIRERSTNTILFIGQKVR